MYEYEYEYEYEYVYEYVRPPPALGAGGDGPGEQRMRLARARQLAAADADDMGTGIRGLRDRPREIGLGARCKRAVGPVFKNGNDDSMTPRRDTLDRTVVLSKYDARHVCAM